MINSDAYVSIKKKLFSYVLDTANTLTSFCISS